jgi:hypothetical protein
MITIVSVCVCARAHCTFQEALASGKLVPSREGAAMHSLVPAVETMQAPALANLVINLGKQLAARDAQIQDLETKAKLQLDEVRSPATSLVSPVVMSTSF